MSQKSGAQLQKVSVEESAHTLGRSPSAVRRYVVARKLDGVKMRDGHYEIDAESVRRLAEQLKPRGAHSAITGRAVTPTEAKKELGRRQNRYYGGEKTETAKAILLQILAERPLRQSECTTLVAEQAAVSEITVRYALKALLAERRIVQSQRRKGARANAAITYRLSELVQAAPQTVPAPKAASLPENAPLPKKASLPKNVPIQKAPTLAKADPSAKAAPLSKVATLPAAAGVFPVEAVIVAGPAGNTREYVQLDVATKALKAELTMSAVRLGRINELEGQLQALEAKIHEVSAKGPALGPLTVREVVFRSNAEGDVMTIVTDAKESGPLKRGALISISVN